MARLIRGGEKSEREGCRLVILEQDIPSFSWGRDIVIGKKDLEESPAIFTHELMHVQHRHSLDLVLFLPFQLLFWWNPLVWITREELRLLHEYEADEVQGRVIVQFTIGSDGAVRDVQVLRGVREDLDAEAVRVVSASPKWEPGMQNGKPVPVSFTFPVVYKLQ